MRAHAVALAAIFDRFRTGYDHDANGALSGDPAAIGALW